MVASTTSTASLIQEQVASLLVQPLEAASVVLSSGVRIFDSSEPLRIPKLTAGVSAGFVGENQEIPDGDVTFGEIDLMPSDRTSIKALTKFSNESLRQSSVGLDAVLKQRLVNDVSKVLDTALLSGDGANKSITGIIHQAGVSTGTLDVTNADSFLDVIGVGEDDEVEPDRWFFNKTDWRAIRKLKNGNGDYLVQPDITKAARFALHGIPVTPTNKLPVGTAVLAKMDEIAVVRDLAPSITLLSERYAEFDQQAIRVVTRYDLGLLHPEGVVVLTAAV